MGGKRATGALGYPLSSCGGEELFADLSLMWITSGLPTNGKYRGRSTISSWRRPNPVQQS
jgi:hypothetical protein